MTLSLTLKNSNGKIVNGKVIVRDGMALAVFDNPTLALKLYEMDKKKGSEVFFNKEYNAYVQKYKNKTKEQIWEILKKEVEQAGGNIEIPRIEKIKEVKEKWR